MAKYAALYSGQGSQYAGMGKELYENFPEARRIYECAGDILGFDVKRMSFEGDEQTITQTRYAQPLLFTLSMACFEAARGSLPFPDAVCGHSVGEIAALCCAGAYSLETGLHIIRARAENMAGVKTHATMIAVMSGDLDAIGAACVAAGGYVVPVNYNQPGQTVIAGEYEPTIRAGELLAEQGVRTVRLNVSGAFHTKLMEPAQPGFRAVLDTLEYGVPKADFYSNLTGGKLVIEDYPDYFTRQIVSPVRFVEDMAAMDADGVEICVEFGPKKVAATLAKKNVKRFQIAGVEDLKTLEKAAALFR